MNLWPLPRRVEVPDAADPLVVPAGASVSLALTLPGSANPANRSRSDREPIGRSGLPEELGFALGGLRRALQRAGVGLAATRRRPDAGEDAGAPSVRPLPQLGRLVDAGETPAGGPVVRVDVGSAGAGSGSPVAVPTDESYRLRVHAGGIDLHAATPTGAFRAAATLKQWFAAHGKPTDSGFEAPAVEIEDRPDFGVRGAMLDVSRNRVPTMKYLERLVDRLADWKINHLQLYVEHAYAYEDHEDVWRDASPFTAGEIRSLDAYCRERFIELTPNQNSFGHFHRWLVHDRYRPLAEVPEGFRHPFSIDPEPFSLCATDPRVPELLEGLYDELLPQFGSRRFNVGLDETFDLGRGRSAEACAERGKPAVYLDFLHRIHGLVAERGRQMLFWGDIILEHPELIDRVPEDAVALCWGYEADHPFADQCARLAASGREFWVCPGTSSWASFGGRLQNAAGNLAAAATAGRETGARGFLITDWGDHGHLQPPAIAELPLSIGAGFAWSVEAARAAANGAGRDEEAWLDHASRFVYDGDETLARTVVELDAIARDCGGPVMNGTTLFYLLRFIDDDLCHRRFRRLSIAAMQRTYARLASNRERLARSTVAPSYAALDWTCRLMMWCCRLGIERLAAGRGEKLDRLAPKIRATLGADLRRIAGDLAPIWLAFSREGGLTESQALLLRAAEELESVHAETAADGAKATR